MKRPVLWALGFLVCGILLGGWDIALLPYFVVAAFFICAVLHKIYKYPPVFFFVLFFIVGAWRIGHSLHSHTVEPIHAEFSGYVLDVGYTGGGNRRAVVSGIHPKTGENVRIMAYIRIHQPRVELGQRVLIRGELMPLALPNNPGGYNQFQHLRSQKIDAVVWPETIERGEINRTFIVRLRAFRDRLSAVYDKLLPPSEAAAIKSMVLGDRMGLDRDLSDLYRTMGIFHILSISGLHVTILMMVVNKLLEFVMHKRKAGILALLIMIVYCLLSGAAIATVRAVTMGGVLVFGKVLFRDYDLLASVSWAAVVLLVFEPLQLFNAGFQLSFGAVYAMGTLTVPVSRLMGMLRIFRGAEFIKYRESLAAGIAAVAASYVISAHHFYEIPLYSVAGNLIIMPTTTILLVLGLAIGLVGLVWLPAALLLSGPVYFILRFYEIFAVFFQSLPSAMIRTGGGNAVVSLLGILVLIVFAYTFNGFGETFRRRKILLVLSVFALTAAVSLNTFPLGLRITRLDTHGNYTVLRHRSDTLIIGAATGGESALFTYLNKKGINRASLLLTEPLGRRDTERLYRLLERTHTLYLPGHAVGTTASVMNAVIRDATAHLSENGLPMPKIIYLYDGDIRTSNGLNIRVSAQPMGRLGIEAEFRGNLLR